MQRHRFDPLSAALGLLALIAAVVVISGRLVDSALVAPLLAVGALVVGLGLVPWSSFRRQRDT